MRTFLRFDFRFTRQDTTGSILRSILSLYPHAPAVQFCLAGGGEGDLRVLKRFPEMRPFEQDSGLINLDARFEEHRGDPPTDVDIGTLKSIADGIPRSYPFAYATFYVPRLPWEERASDAVIPARKLSGIMPDTIQIPLAGFLLSSSWWTPRRHLFARVTIPIATPDSDAVAILKLPAEWLAGLRQIGATSPPKVLVLAEQDDEAATRDSALERLRAGWSERLPALLDELPLPHVLPVDPGQSVGTGLTSPHKSTLQKALRPRHWKYRSDRSGPGYLTLTKASPGGLRVAVHFDVGTWSHKCSCFVDVNGVGWATRFAIGFVRGNPLADYPITSDEAWTRIVENIATVLDHFERTTLLELDALCGPLPKWFANSE